MIPILKELRIMKRMGVNYNSSLPTGWSFTKPVTHLLLIQVELIHIAIAHVRKCPVCPLRANITV